MLLASPPIHNAKVNTINVTVSYYGNPGYFDYYCYYYSLSLEYNRLSDRH
jgi:hypothetical protein